MAEAMQEGNIERGKKKQLKSPLNLTSQNLWIVWQATHCDRIVCGHLFMAVFGQTLHFSWTQ